LFGRLLAFGRVLVAPVFGIVFVFGRVLAFGRVLVDQCLEEF
jgi:hypothetical protein